MSIENVIIWHRYWIWQKYQFWQNFQFWQNINFYKNIIFYKNINFYKNVNLMANYQKMATSPPSSHLVILVTSLFCTEIKFWPITGSTFMIKYDQIWLLLVSWGLSGGCFVCVWKVSGGCLDWKVSGVWGRCLWGVW